jgi:8-oxo-dGTP pyrophosphatase MutT (NUDIX family)
MPETRTLFPELQVGALCWRHKPRSREFEILLITSRETKRWVIPKGWPMEGRTDYNAARREAFEEAGVEGHMRTTAVGHYHYDKRKRDGRSIHCKVDVYALEVSSIRRNWPESRERQRNWFAPQIAATLVQEVELQKLIGQFSI